MYRFSRSIYRELAPASSRQNGVTRRRRGIEVLDACEATMRRLAYDRRYFARPAKYAVQRDPLRISRSPSSSTSTWSSTAT